MGTLIDDTNGLTNTPILASKNNVAKFQPSLNENEPTTTTTPQPYRENLQLIK